MTTYVRAPEAARRLGVSTATLYAYVSRGRIGRITAADGRASLFDLAEVESLAARSRREPTSPPPTIDVQIASAITQLNEDGLSYRGHRVDDLMGLPFEAVAELLWGDELPTTTPTWPYRPTTDPPRAAVLPTENPPDIVTLIEIATDEMRRTEASANRAQAIATARSLLASIPAGFGSTRKRGPFAARVIAAWRPRPSAELVDATNAALVLLADHELATSTLAVRVAASVRSSPAAALVAGLATVEGALHGSAARHAHELLVAVEQRDARAVLDEHRAARRRVAGFGHSVYRQRDPRFELLLDRVRELPDPHGRMDVIDTLLTEAGASVPQRPNIDLALGALSFVAELPPDTPLFAIARIAGWTAHYIEELDERPVRYRGLSRTMTAAASGRRPLVT